MTIEEKQVVDYLSQYRLSKYQEYLILLEITDVRTAQVSARSPRIDGLPQRHGGHSTLSGYVAGLGDIIADLERQAKETAEKLRKAEAVIEAVAHPQQKMVLQARYIHGRTAEQVAEDLDISVRYSQILHKAGIDAILKSGALPDKMGSGEKEETK